MQDCNCAIDVGLSRKGSTVYGAPVAENGSGGG